MNKFFESMFIAFAATAILALGAVFSGTILWLIWPIAIPAALPGLIASGILASRLAWWEAVCLAWLCGILFKFTLTTKKE